MIQLKQRIINQLLSKIYVDKKDATLIRVDVDNVGIVLSNHGYNLPNIKFEKTLEQMLNQKLVGAKVTEGLKYAMANLIIDLADRMHIEEIEVMKYIMEHDTEEDIVELQTKIKDWRKKHYGAMGTSEKAALLDALHDKLRPDVLDQIRRA